jgi:hypothetical protein
MPSPFHDATCLSGRRSPTDWTLIEPVMTSSNWPSVQRVNLTPDDNDFDDEPVSAISETRKFSTSCFAGIEASSSTSKRDTSSQKLDSIPSKVNEKNCSCWSAADCWFEEPLFYCILLTASVATFASCLTSLSPSCLVAGVAVTSFLVYLFKLR